MPALPAPRRMLWTVSSCVGIVMIFFSMSTRRDAVGRFHAWAFWRMLSPSDLRLQGKHKCTYVHEGRAFQKSTQEESMHPSTIEWTEATWNQIRGCVKVSPGGRRHAPGPLAHLSGADQTCRSDASVTAWGTVRCRPGSAHLVGVSVEDRCSCGQHTKPTSFHQPRWRVCKTSNRRTPSTMMPP